MDGMYRDVTDFCAYCESCAIYKHATNKKPASLKKFPEVTALFQRISMAILGPLPSNNEGNQRVETVAKAKVVSRLSTPEQLLSDRGTYFTSQLMKEVCNILQGRKLLSTQYHPASIGQVERSDQTFVIILSHIVNRDQRDWDGWLPYALLTDRYYT
ncbi:hypothetical protein PR048_013725 [Dryococelus australis]|uniref:Integrase catalytic domain-containing protein n=1 Tax=Dryococelus australis TaxID=614101 RepID=A0ABQ9HT95_9NEOP|nr:hypothetical protein PR048_013725 [Dryococelus australis]